jgi:hypothetical protein
MELEDMYSGILTELGLVQIRNEETLLIEGRRRPELPALVVLYAILESTRLRDSLSLSFEQLYTDAESVGSIFALSKEGLVEKLQEITQLYPNDIVFKNEAGIRELQYKHKPEPFNVLKRYYGSQV